MPLMPPDATVRREAMRMQPQQPPQAEGKTGIGPWPYMAMAAGNGADAITTLRAITSGRGKEGNPMMPKGAVGIGLAKAAGTVTLALLMRKLAKSHKKSDRDVAKALGYIDAGLMAGLAIRNEAVTR